MAGMSDGRRVRQFMWIMFQLPSYAGDSTMLRFMYGLSFLVHRAVTLGDFPCYLLAPREPNLNITCLRQDGGEAPSGHYLMR